MWVLPDTLPSPVFEQPRGAAIAFVDTPDNAAPIATYDPAAQYADSQISRGLTPITSEVPFSAPDPQGVITTVVALDEVYSISHNGNTYQPALGETPDAGEFTFNPETQELTIATLEGTLEPLLGFAVNGAALTAIPTDYVNPTLFQLFWNLPILGEISWGVSLEGHPSSSLTLRCGRDLIYTVRDRFRVGQQLSWAGIGFSVTSFAEQMENTDTSPGIIFNVQVSLGGWWEAERHRELSFLLGRIGGASGAKALPAQCVPGANNRAVGRSRTTTVAAMAAQVGVPFIVATPPLVPKQSVDSIIAPTTSALLTSRMSRSSRRSIRPIGPWSIEVPADATAETTISWESEMQSRLRINGCFADYSSPTGVYARDIWSTRTWNYSVLSLDTTAQGDTRFSNSHYGYARQFKAEKLTGLFSDPPESLDEDTQGNPQNPGIPRWIPKPRKTYEIPGGDENPTIPPPQIKATCTMSLNADSSGPTKESITTTFQGGFEVRRKRQVYGLAYTSIDITDNQGRCTFPSLAPFWTLVEEEITEIEINDTTGYIVGSRTTGRKLARYKPESDNFELRGLPPGDEEQLLYQHRWIPSRRREGKLLRKYAQYYRDAANEIPPYEVIQLCQPDGTLVDVVVRDPNYTVPAFEAASRTYTYAFNWALDPRNGEDENRLVMAGQELDAHQTIQILPSNGTVGSGFFDDRAALSDGDSSEEDRFLQRNSEFSAEGPQLRNLAEKKSFGINNGRPSPANRIPDRFEREEPEAESGDPSQRDRPDEADIDHILCTPGFSPDDPSQGSLSFQEARSLGQALMGARATLKLEDVQNSVGFQFSLSDFNLSIRPLDRIMVRTAFESIAMRVTQCSWTVQIEGAVDGAPFITQQGGVSVTAGIDREIPFTHTTRINPAKKDPGPGNRNLTLFFERNLVPINNLFQSPIRSRGNIL